jgi:hypothetical protein
MCALIILCLLMGNAKCLMVFHVWYLVLVYVWYLLYIYILLLVTLTIIHERAPPTLDDGLPSDTVGREDDGGFLGPQ